MWLVGPRLDCGAPLVLQIRAPPVLIGINGLAGRVFQLGSRYRGDCGRSPHSNSKSDPWSVGLCRLRRFVFCFWRVRREVGFWEVSRMLARAPLPSALYPVKRAQ